MARVKVKPTGVERMLGPDELIVTKTDTKGLIRYANEVFLRMSKYTEDEVIGQPHNMIRHPDMPRAVFKLLWDTIASGREMFAYVVNLASDGAHYWVLAHVTPSFDAHGRIVGYHSNRRCPQRPAVEQISGVYRELITAERAHSTGSAALEASSARLADLLAEQGRTYDQLFWDITTAART